MKELYKSPVITVEDLTKVLQQKHRTALQHRRLIISTSSLVQSAISQAYSNSVITLGIKNSG